MADIRVRTPRAAPSAQRVRAPGQEREPQWVEAVVPARARLRDRERVPAGPRELAPALESALPRAALAETRHSRDRTVRTNVSKRKARIAGASVQSERPKVP